MKFRILHPFCGIGGSALGAAAASTRFGGHDAVFETVGGIDLDPLACKDFERLTGAPALCADMHDLTPEQLRAFAGDVAPDVVMSSPPCKGFSGLLSSKRAAEPKYQRMNRLLIDTLSLLCSTWDEPPALIFFENVPRISSRGADMVAEAVALLEGHGYAVDVGTHDCGEVGGLAQHRRRWFLLARHRSRVQQLVYVPPSLRVRACGEVLAPLPMPGDVVAGGAMHKVPNLSWRNWVRLALIPPGGDWRDLPGVVPPTKARREVHRRDKVTPWEAPADPVTGPGGSASDVVADPRQRDWYSNVYKVTGWDDPAGTITGAPKPSSGAVVVADPRFANVDRVTPWEAPVGTITRSPAPSSGAAAVADPRWGGGRLGVVPWEDPANTVTGEGLPTNGANAVADPRAFRGVLGVKAWDEASATITGNARPASGAFAVADPRNMDPDVWQRVAGVTPWTEPVPTVTGNSTIHAGAFQVADPRLGCEPRAGAYRVLSWREAAATITASLAIDNGAAAVADPRINPDKAPPFTPVIVSADGTWHRPLTTLELAALQGFPVIVDGEPLVLAGTSHTRWREAIGNAVPPPAALAIAEQLLRALLVSRLGGFVMDNGTVWVAPPAVIQ